MSDITGHLTVAKTYRASSAVPPTEEETATAKKAAQKAACEIASSSALPPPSGVGNLDGDHDLVKKPGLSMIFGRTDAAFEVVTCTVNMDAFSTIGDAFYDVVSRHAPHTINMDLAELVLCIQRLAYQRACSLGSASNNGDINKCALTRIPSPLLVPQAILEALEVLGNDSGMATGHYYVIQPEDLSSADYRKWDSTSLAKWQVFIKRLGALVRLMDFYANRHLDSSLVHQVVATSLGSILYVFSFCPCQDVIREALWVGAAGNFITPVRDVENCGLEPIIVGSPRQVLIRHLNGMWMTPPE
ncbi:hypothetical protein V5799_012110 [Amblyomma americanum]|uniref:Uncharacterized protein n=1 Tax=Amblyomma americanum TaxID=6943 RepID=A0AAQ4EEX9_AMBAM